MEYKIEEPVFTIVYGIRLGGKDFETLGVFSLIQDAIDYKDRLTATKAFEEGSLGFNSGNTMLAVFEHLEKERTVIRVEYSFPQLERLLLFLAQRWPASKVAPGATPCSTKR